MSEHAKPLWRRVWEALFSPTCPNCGHDNDIHYEGTKCLGAHYDRGVHVGWCTCMNLKKEKGTG